MSFQRKITRVPVNRKALNTRKNGSSTAFLYTQWSRRSGQESIDISFDPSSDSESLKVKPSFHIHNAPWRQWILPTQFSSSVFVPAWNQFNPVQDSLEDKNISDFDETKESKEKRNIQIRKLFVFPDFGNEFCSPLAPLINCGGNKNSRRTAAVSDKISVYTKNRQRTT